MTDPLRELLRRAEWPGSLFDADELADWPADARVGLGRLGLLVEAEPAATAACDSCGRDHVERVAWSAVPGRPRRAFIPCPVAGRVPIDPGRLRRWAVCTPVLARRLAAAVGAAGTVSERAPGRVWKLGTVRAGGRVWAAFLCAGLLGPGGPAVIDRVADLRAPNALLFVPDTLPPDVARALGARRQAVSLVDLLALTGAGLTADRSVLESALGPTPGTAAVGATPPVVASWEEVTLVVGDRHLRVQVGGAERRVGFAEAGFADRRRKEAPNQAWMLLTKLARAGGVLSSPDRVTTKSGSLKRGMTRLRDALRGLTGIDDDPLHPVGRGGGYRARFRVRASEGAVFPTPAGAGWERVTLTEIEAGVVAVAVEAEAVGVAFGPDEGGRGRWEATTEAAERTARYPVAELGLSKPARDALLAVLRSGGTVRRKGTDPGMLALGKGLSRFLGIDGPPFEFRGGAWVARFEARSLVPPSDR